MTKKQTIKSTLSLLLVLVMLVSLLPAMTIPAHAAGTEFKGGGCIETPGTVPAAADIKFTEYLEISAKVYGKSANGSWGVADDGDAQVHTIAVDGKDRMIFYAKATKAVTVNYEAVFPAGSDTQLAAAGVYDYSADEWLNQIGTCSATNWYSVSKYEQQSSGKTWSGTVSLEVGDVIAIGVYSNYDWGDYSATIKLSLDESSLVPQKQYTISPAPSADTSKIWQSDSVYNHPMSVCVTDPSGVPTWVHGGDNNNYYPLEADLYNATFKASVGSTVKIVLYFCTDDPLNNDDTVDVFYVPGNITDGAGVVVHESPYTGKTTLGQGTTLTYTFTVPEDTSDATLYYDIVPVHYPIKVEKDLDSATVTIAQSGNLKHVGAATLSGSSMTFAVDKHNAGSNVTFTASGYAPLAYDVEWYLGGTKVADGASYTAAPDTLIAGGTVEAKFIEKKFSVSATVDSACTNMGSVSTTASSVGYGTNVTFTAVPVYGYEFVGWYKNGEQVQNAGTSYTTQITENTSLTAKFKVSTRTVAAYVQAGSQGLGTATVTPGTVNYGSTATFTATANDGYEFVAWYDANGTNPVFANPYVVSITADTTLYAKFDKRWIEPKFGYDDKGTYTITGEDINYTVTNADVSFYAWVNDEVTLTVTSSAENYEFAGWYVNGKQISAQQTFTFKLGDYEKQMIYPQWKEKANVIVTFKPVEGGSYTVNGAAPTGGAVAYYADIVVKATANANYRFVAWVDGNGNVLSGNAEETFLMATVKDKTITPVFEYIYATITLPGVSGGSYTITPATEGDSTAAVTVNGSDTEFIGIKGNSYTVTATPDSEHVFVRWEDANGNQLGTSETYTIENYGSGSYVKPVFADKYVTITLPAIAEGSYTLTSKDDTDTVTVAQDTVAHKALKDTAYTLTIDIPHSYAFLGWKDANGSSLGDSTTITVENVNNGVQPVIEDRSILQKLPAPTNGCYTIQADGSDVILETVTNEAVTIKGRYDLGYTLTAIPADGYHFVMWIDQNGAPVSYNAVMNGYKLSESTSVTPVFASNRVTMRFPAVIGATYYVYCGDALEATVTDADEFVTGDYNADYKIVVGALENNYQNIGYLIDENGTKIDGSDAAGFTFKLDANKVIKPFIGYYGTDIALGAVIGSGSYTFGEKGCEPAYTIRDTAATASNIDRTKTYVLTATADAGYMFAQWQTKDGKFLSDEATLEGNMPASVVAMFVKEDSAAYVVDSIPYYHLNLAVAAAQKANVKTVLVTAGGMIYHSQNQTDFEIPSGVTFIVPHKDDVDSIKSKTDSASYACASYISDYPDNYATPNDGHTFIELKLPANNTLTVNGVMSVGGTVNGAGAIAGGYPHANVHLGSGASLVVGESSYGYLSTCGFVYGPGTVEVKAKGQLLQPFAFNDFKGGGYTVGAAAKMTSEANNFQATLDNAGDNTGILPFNRYTLMGVHSKTIVSYGGYVTGYVDMFAGGEHNRCTVHVVHYDKNSGLFALKDQNATATITYEPGKTVSTENNIGRTKISLNGNTELGGLTFNINVGVRATIDSRKAVLPIPYNWEIEVAGGTFTVANKLQLLPGATIRVNEGAAMNVASQLTVYKGLTDHTSAGVSVKGTSNFTAVLSGYESNYSGYNVVYPTKPYPSTAALTNAGFSGAGELIVNGTLNLNSGSFGGVIQTESNNAVVNVAGGMGLSTYTRLGGAGYWQYTVGQAGFMYELAGATKHNLTAQLVNAADGKLTDMVAGKTYYGTTATNGTIDSYSYTLCHAAKGNTVYTTEVTVGSEEAPLGIATKGAWGEYTVEIIDTTKNETVREVFMANADVSDRDFYSDANGETKVETITASGTVYYIPSYTVIWMDGETNLGESKVLHGKAPAYPSEFTEPTKEGYAFIGWAADAAATTGTKLEDLAAVTEDIAYYAVFAKEYTITYNMNEGAWAADAVVPETYVVGSELTLPTAESLTREGWTFVGWYGNAAYTGDKLTEITADPAANVDLYARWKQKVEAVEATCIADGNLEYWTDGINNYKDEALTEQYEENGWIVKSKGHTYGDAVYEWNGTTLTVTLTCDKCAEGTDGKILSGSTEGTVKTTTEGDCQTKATTTYTATVMLNETEYTNETTIKGEFGAHNWGDATCAAPKTCSICNATEGDKLAHTYGEPDFTWNATAESATCTATFTCSVCEAPEEGAGDIADRVVTVECEVDVKDGNRVDATCSEAGSVIYTATVEFSDKTYTKDSDAVEIPATGKHSLTATEAKDATCTAPGNSAYWTCGTCGKYFSDAEGKTEIQKDTWILEQLQHSYTGEWVITDEGHAKKCVNGCDGTDTVAPHTDSDSNKVCDDCQYAIPGTGGGEEETITTEDIFTSYPSTATITAPEGGWKIGESNTFTVANDLACVVAYTTDGGTTYEPLTATASGDAYSFTVTLTENMKLAIAVKGDLVSNGTIDSADAYQVLRAAAGSRQLNALQFLAVDIVKNGDIDSADAYQILRAAAGSRIFAWN